MIKEQEILETVRIDTLFEKLSALIVRARYKVITAANIAEMYTKYSIGQYIVEDEQQGNSPAEYGKQVLKGLSARLTERFGEGWSVETLKLCRRLFTVYSNSVTNGYPIQNKKDNQRLLVLDSYNGPGPIDGKHKARPKFTLSFSHYIILMRIDNLDARSFYEIECTQQQWSKRQLMRFSDT